jgi:signal transduction histidine kinase
VKKLNSNGKPATVRVMEKYRIHLRFAAQSVISIVFGNTIFYLNKLHQDELTDVYWLTLIAAGVVWASNLIFIAGFMKHRETAPPPLRPFWWIINGIGLTLLAPLANSPRVLFYSILTVSMLSVFIRQRQRDRLIYLIFLTIAFGVIDYGVLPEFPLADLLFLMAILAGGTWLVHYLSRKIQSSRLEISQLRREVGRLNQTNVRLQNHVVQVKEFVLTQERDRIAREIHDILGHTLTGLAVKLQAIESLVEIDQQRSMLEIRNSYNMVREALYEVRLTVSALRDPMNKILRGRTLWVQLCETFAQCTNVNLQINIENEFNQVDDNINAVVYRFIQEALTNAYRHGEATLIDVAVWKHQNELRVRVSDNGHGVTSLREGFGIIGVRERLSELGGQVGWRSEYGKGFDIAIVVPLGNEGSDEND